MAAKERGLGRGLDALWRSPREEDPAARETHKLALSQLTPGAHQPRKLFDDSALTELSISIKNQGVIQPLIVRPREGTVPQIYEIVAGERRWRAAKLAGLTEVPVIIAHYTDAEAMAVALIENLQRENLNPLEEAEALQALREVYDLSQEDLAAKLGKSRSAVANALRLLQLPEAIRRGLAAGQISAGHARALLAVGNDAIRERLYQAALQQSLSVREMESAVEEWKRTGTMPEHLLGAMEAQDEHESPAPARSGRRAPKPQSLKDIQKRLRLAVHQGASISGSEEKGRIALPYTSRGELEFLLHLLGLEQGAPILSTPDGSVTCLEEQAGDEQNNGYNGQAGADEATDAFEPAAPAGAEYSPQAFSEDAAQDAAEDAGEPVAAGMTGEQA